MTVLTMKVIMPKHAKDIKPTKLITKTWSPCWSR